MKKLVIFLLTVFVFLSACEMTQKQGDATQLQNAVDKIKAEIQENLNAGKKG